MGSGTFFFDYLVPIPHATQMLTNYNRGDGLHGNEWLHKLKVNQNHTIIYLMNPHVVSEGFGVGSFPYDYYKRNQRVFKNGDICKAIAKRMTTPDLMNPKYKNYNPDTGNLGMYVISVDTWLNSEDVDAFESCMGKGHVYYKNDYKYLIEKLLREDNSLNPHQKPQDSAGGIVK